MGLNFHGLHHTTSKIRRLFNCLGNRCLIYQNGSFYSYQGWTEDKRQPPPQNPVFEISQHPHHQLTPNFRSTIFSTPSHPYLIFRPSALLLHFLVQELWLLWFSRTPVIPLSGVKPHQKSGIHTTSKHYPLLPTPKTTPTALQIFLKANWGL